MRFRDLVTLFYNNQEGQCHPKQQEQSAKRSVVSFYATAEIQ